jgi:hypothetical protein
VTHCGEEAEDLPGVGAGCVQTGCQTGTSPVNVGLTAASVTGISGTGAIPGVPAAPQVRVAPQATQDLPAE